MRARTNGDRLFFLIVIILVVGGIAMFASAALGLLAREDSSVGRLALTQLLLGLIPGGLALIGLRYAPQKLIMAAAPLVYGVSILATLLVFTPLGIELNGARRWIDVGFTTIQPGEFLKAGTILMLAWYFARVRGKVASVKEGLVPFLAIVGIPSLILLLQPNTSTVLIIGTTGLALFLLAGAKFRHIALIALCGVILLAALLFSRPYLMQRFMTFLHPDQGALTSGYQVQQSLIAIGNGGIIGRGFGQSVQKFNYLPEPVGDSVFAVYAEEFGFIGAIIMILLFTAFAARGFAIAADASTLFGSLAATGFTLIITLSAFLNMGAMLGLFPLTGLPLPFVSHGGTALFAALAGVGVILNVAASRKGKRVVS